MALSHKDWELPNSRIWLPKTDIDHGLDLALINRGGLYGRIFTIQYPVPLFSLCTKSLIAGLKNANQLSEENGGGPFC